MIVNEQAIEAVKQRWTWKSMHWPDLDSDQITAVLEAALPHLGVEEAQATIKRLEEENAPQRDYGVECAKCTRLYNCTEHTSYDDTTRQTSTVWLR